MIKKFKKIFEFNKNQPISSLILSNIILAYIFCSLIISSIQLSVEYRNYKKDMVGSLNSLAENYLPGIKTAMWDYQWGLLDNLAQAILANNNVSYVEILDDKGISKSLKKIDSGGTRYADFTIEYKFFHKYNGKDRLLGTLIISYSKDFLLNSLYSRFVQIVINTLCMLLFLALLLWVYIKKFVVRPLKDFSDQVANLSKDNLHNMIELKNYNIEEIITLEEWFNIFLAEILQGQEILMEHNLQLEEKIKERTKELVEKEQRFRSIFEHANAGITFIDVEGNLISSNASFEKLIGYTKEELVGNNFKIFTHEDDVDIQINAMQEVLEGKTSQYRLEKRYIKKNQEIVWVDLAVTAIKDENNKVTNFVGLSIDVTERKKAEKELKRLYSLALDANSLTGLPGNNSISKRIEKAIKKNENFCIIYADLDNFKAYNDNYGFAMGDKILLFTADILKNSIKELGIKDYFIGHIGGDDFVAFVPSEFAYSYSDLIIKHMAEEIGAFYSPEDLKQGFICSTNRQGEKQDFPFVSISMAAIDLTASHFSTYLQVNDVLSVAKKQAKHIVGNSFFMERRTIL